MSSYNDTILVKYCLETKNSNFSSSISELIRMGSLDPSQRAERIPQEVIIDLINSGASDAASAMLCGALELNREVSPNSIAATLQATAEIGKWQSHNALLVRAAKHLNPKSAKLTFAHLLEQLDFINIEYLLKFFDCVNLGKNFDAEKACFQVARMNYEFGSAVMKSQENVLAEILTSPRLRKWAYMLVARGDGELARHIYERMPKMYLGVTDRLDHMAQLLKACWMHGDLNSMVKMIVDNFDGEPSLGDLRVNASFCRAYVFSCDRLFLDNKLRAKICRVENAVLSPYELMTINLKREVLARGVDAALRDAFGPFDEPEKDYLEIPLIIYGREYVEAVRYCFVQSALADKDFLNLPKSYKAVISICTTSHDIRGVTDALSPLVAHGFELRIVSKFVLDADEIPFKRMWFYIDAIYRVERARGVVIVMCPDAIFGSGLVTLIEKCPVGGGAGGCLFRVSWSQVNASQKSGELQEILASENKNFNLVNVAVHKWRHYSHRLFDENLSPNFQTKIIAGARYNSWQGVPFVNKPVEGYAERLVKMSLDRYQNVYGDQVGQALDHELIGYLESVGKLYMVRSYNEFVFAELARDRGYAGLWKFQLPMGFPRSPTFAETFPL